MVEGTSLLRKHLGLNLNPGFESLRLRQKYECPRKRAFLFCGDEQAKNLACVGDSKGIACKRFRGLHVRESLRLPEILQIKRYPQ